MITYDPANILGETETTTATPPAVPGPVLVTLADVAPRQIDWLWPGRIPLGRITLLVGRPGEGKSFLTTDLTARVTTATPFPDGAPCPSGSVLLIGAEDDAGDTVRPRVEAHGADLSRVHLLSVVRRVDEEGKSREFMFTLSDVGAMEEALNRLPDCRLVVIDPIGSFLGGGTDAHRDNEVRAVLAPIAKLAEKHGPAVLMVAHRRKGGGSVADDLALGSRAFTGIARAVWHLSRDEQDKRRRLLLPGKNNLAPEGDGLAFTIAGEPARIQWERDPVTMSADDALANENQGPGRPPEERDEAEAFLRAELGDMGEHPASDMRKAALAAGLNWRTVQRASTLMGVIKHRSGFGGAFIWRLPKPGATIRATSPLTHNSVTYGTNGEYASNTPHSCLTEHHTCHNSLLGEDSGTDEGGDS